LAASVGQQVVHPVRNLAPRSADEPDIFKGATLLGRPFKELLR